MASAWATARSDRRRHVTIFDARRWAARTRVRLSRSWCASSARVRFRRTAIDGRNSPTSRCRSTTRPTGDLLHYPPHGSTVTDRLSPTGPAVDTSTTRVALWSVRNHQLVKRARRRPRLTVVVFGGVVILVAATSGGHCQRARSRDRFGSSPRRGLKTGIAELAISPTVRSWRGWRDTRSSCGRRRPGDRR